MPTPPNKAAAAAAIPWIKIADFEESSFWLTIQNTTTKTQTGKLERLELNEVSATGITALIPARLCALGHHLTLRFSVRIRNPVNKPPTSRETSALEITAKVVAEEKFGPNSKVIEVKFLQFDEQKWRDILNRISRTQETAEDMIKRMND